MDLKGVFDELISAAHNMRKDNNRLYTKLQRIGDLVKDMPDSKMRDDIVDILNGIEYPERNKGI
jgi:hypothetical protein